MKKQYLGVVRRLSVFQAIKLQITDFGVFLNTSIYNLMFNAVEPPDFVFLIFHYCTFLLRTELTSNKFCFCIWIGAQSEQYPLTKG